MHDFNVPGNGEERDYLKYGIVSGKVFRKRRTDASDLDESYHGGEITIIMVSVGDQITVNISDTGIGMDERTIKHIFDKYYQGDSSHATIGFGLGLSIVKRIVDLCGGDITATSAPGLGSTFSVVLKAPVHRSKNK